MEIKKVRYGHTVPYRARLYCTVLTYRTHAYFGTFKRSKAVQFKVKTLSLQDQFDVIQFDIMKVDQMAEPATQHREVKSG